MKLNFDLDHDHTTNMLNTPKPEVVETTPFDKFDITKVEREDSFVAVKQRIKEMEAKASALKVVDESTFKTGMEMLVQLKALEKAADDFKKNHSMFKIIAQFKNGFDKLIRENVRNEVQKIREALSPKIGFYQKTQAEIERRKAQKEAEENAKKAQEEADLQAKEQREKEEADKQAAIDLQARLNLEADEAGVERVSVPIPEISDEPIVPIIPETTVTQKSEKVVADHGTARIESSWIVEIVDPPRVERIYCSPDIKKLQAAVDAGVMELAGCLVKETFDPKIRLSKKKQELDFKF